MLFHTDTDSDPDGEWSCGVHKQFYYIMGKLLIKQMQVIPNIR